MAAFILLIILVMSSSAAAQSVVQFQIFLVGENVTLSCSPTPSQYIPPSVSDDDCNGEYSLHWFKMNDEGILTQLTTCLVLESNLDTSRYTVDTLENAYNLHIAHAQVSDAGRYICTTYSRLRRPSSVEELDIKLNGYQTSCAISPQDAQVGDDVSLICSLVIERSLQWMTSNGTLVGSRQVTNYQNSLVFNFTAKEEENFETFTCVSITTSGVHIPTCSVTPLSYPDVYITPMVSRVKEGGNVTFFCKARFRNMASYLWYNYTWIVNDVITSQGTNISTYTVDDIQLFDNISEVKCIVFVGMDHIESTRAVIYVEPVKKSTPRIATNNMDQGTPIFNALTVCLLILVILSFSVIGVLTVCLVKSRRTTKSDRPDELTPARTHAPYSALHLENVTQSEYQTCRVESTDRNETYESVDVDYENPPSVTMDVEYDDPPSETVDVQYGNTGVYEVPKGE